MNILLRIFFKKYIKLFLINKISFYREALAIDGFDNDNIRFYANPTSSLVNISYSNALNKVTITNLLGQVLQENKSNELQVTVDLSAYPSATYIIRVDADAKSKIIKVVKKD